MEDLLRDQEVALRVRRRAIARRPAGQGQGKGNEQAAVAAAASGSTGTGAAKEPVLFGRFWAPDVEEVPLPRNLRRERTEVSEGGLGSECIAAVARQAPEGGVVRSGGQGVARSGGQRQDSWVANQRLHVSHGDAGEGG